MAFVQVKNTKGLPAVTYQKTIGITTSEMKSVYLSIPVDVMHNCTTGVLAAAKSR